MTTISPVAMPMTDPLAGLVQSITAVVGVVAEIAKAVGGGAGATGTGQGAAGADLATGGPQARGTEDLPAGVLDSISGALAPTDAAVPAPPPEAAPPADAGPGQKAADNAKKYEGTPYAWGGTSPDGFDCSGLTMTALKEAGIEVPRTSQEQYKGGTPVEKDQLQPGDLVFFNGDEPGHVGIYAGDGKVTHAPTTGDVVKTVPLDEAGSYTGARRYT